MAVGVVVVILRALAWNWGLATASARPLRTALRQSTRVTRRDQVLLACARLAEVTATLSLKGAAIGPRRLFIVAFLSVFTHVTVVLDACLPLGVAYAGWAACGVALTALLGRPIIQEPITRTMRLGNVLIAVGVLVVEIGTPRALVRQVRRDPARTPPAAHGWCCV